MPWSSPGPNERSDGRGNPEQGGNLLGVVRSVTRGLAATIVVIEVEGDAVVDVGGDGAVREQWDDRFGCGSAGA